MKVLIIFSGNTISGAEIVLKNYLKNFNNPNIEFFVICSNRKIKEFLVSSRIPEKNIITSVFFSQLGITKSHPITRNFLKIIKIIFVIAGRLLSQLICKTKNIEIVYGKNTFDIVYFPPIKGKLKFIIHIHDILKNDTISNYIKRKLKNVDKIIAVSNTVKESLGQNLHQKTILVYNGIDITFSPTTEYPKERKLIWIGSIEKRKNPQEFIEIISKLNERGHNIKGVIIYKYFERETLQEIMKLIATKKFITIKYNLPRENVLEEIKTSISLVITSIEDPLPNVILESYSQGIPVISPKRSGMLEMVIHKKTGIIYENVNEITENWNEILNFFTESREEILRNIKEILNERFSIAKFIENMNKIILGDVYEKDINNRV